MSVSAGGQVHEIIIRDHDLNEQTPRLLHLVPIGDVLGVAIVREGTATKDDDFVFISMNDLGVALSALGFQSRTVWGAAIIAPTNEPKP